LHREFLVGAWQPGNYLQKLSLSVSGLRPSTMKKIDVKFSGYVSSRYAWHLASLHFRNPNVENLTAKKLDEIWIPGCAINNRINSRIHVGSRQAAEAAA
jgi:hypothetical protein